MGGVGVCVFAAFKRQGSLIMLALNFAARSGTSRKMRPPCTPRGEGWFKPGTAYDNRTLQAIRDVA